MQETPEEKPMEGHLYSRRSLERMAGWKATFQHKVSIASVACGVVCLIETNAGFMLKMPDRPHVKPTSIDNLKKAIKEGNLSLIKGTMPPAPDEHTVEMPPKPKRTRKLPNMSHAH